MYINKIIELLQKYINDYEAKKYELEVLKTKKQLYEELIPLLENKTELNDNKLFISVLLSSIYNNEEYNIEFYKALYLYNQNALHHFDYFGTKIKHQYKNTVEKIMALKKQIQNAYYRFSTAKKVRFPLQKRKPLFDQNFTFKNIQAIISYYATMGEISEKDEVLLNNELEFYNNNIIPTQNQEKEYKTKAYNEVPNILDSGFEMFDLIEVNSNRLETINSYVNDLKSYISQLNIDEIIPIIESYQKYNLETNEYNYIVNEILKMFLFEALDYYKILLDISIYRDKESRHEAIEIYNEYLDKYLLIRDYYNKITDIELNDEVENLEEPEESDEPIDAINPRRLIFSHPASNPTKSRLIDDLKDIPEEYYNSVKNILLKFIAYKKRPKGFNNDKYKNGFVELKEGPIRIIMKHISNNIYCVMGVFVKKSNNDIKAYRTMVIRTITDIITKEKENQELALGELTMQELAKIVVEKARKGTR